MLSREEVVKEGAVEFHRLLNVVRIIVEPRMSEQIQDDQKMLDDEEHLEFRQLRVTPQRM